MNKKSLKERIVDTAIVLFEKHGYHGVTVDKIVEATGTSKGGFYHNFKSKDELLYHIHDVFISYVLEKAFEVHNDTKYNTPISRLGATIESFTKVFDVYQSHITVFYQETTYLTGEYYDRINEKRDEYRKLIVKIIEDGQATGDFRKEVPATISAMAIIGTINWTYKWFNKKGPLTMDTIAQIFNDLMLHSLLTEQGMKKEEAQAFLLKSQIIL